MNDAKSISRICKTGQVTWAWGRPKPEAEDWRLAKSGVTSEVVSCGVTSTGSDNRITSPLAWTQHLATTTRPAHLSHSLALAAHSISSVCHIHLLRLSTHTDKCTYVINILYLPSGFLNNILKFLIRINYDENLLSICFLVQSSFISIINYRAITTFWNASVIYYNGF